MLGGSAECSAREQAFRTLVLASHSRDESIRRGLVLEAAAALRVD